MDKDKLFGNNEWDKIASEYDAYVESDPLRAEILNPAIFALLGEVKGKRILDAGCGNGYLSRLLYRLGAKVVGVDDSARLVAIAKKKSPEDISFYHSDLGRIDFLPEAGFDWVIANMILMDLPDLEEALAQCHRLLKKEGKLLISITHPAFSPPVGKLTKSLPAKLIRGKPWTKVVDYLTSRRSKRGIEGIMGRFTTYHRPVSEYFSSLLREGFEIVQVKEPAASPYFVKKYPKLEFARRIPQYLIIVAKKT